MVFNSTGFLLFMVILMPILGMTKKIKMRHVELLLASYFFYACSDWRFCGLLFGVTLAAYLVSRNIENRKYIKINLYIGVIVPLIVLGIFKYFNFFVDSFARLLGLNNRVISILLPVGISFYTFQAISYVVDVYKGKVDVPPFLELALYISFFPQLVAGPIVKAADFLPQLKEDRNISLKNIEIGVQVFLAGLFKKIVIADHIAVFVDEVYEQPEIFNAVTIIWVIIAYSIQIYCDFSGYSSMAIGCAKILGYDLNKNFDIPYISQSVSEFWKRWHISLSNWLQEYVYFPLGGNRKGKFRTKCNLFITMLLGGLWHGASWNYVIWGGIHGLALCVDKSIKKKNPANIMIQMMGGIVTFLFVSVAWIPFRAQTFAETKQIFEGLLRWKAGVVHIFSWVYFGIVVLIAEVIYDRCLKEKYLNLNTVVGLSVFFVALGLTIGLAYVGSNPFIYFRF